MSLGEVFISGAGSITMTGTAIDAHQGHALWCILRMWNRGFNDRRIQGLTKKEALALAGRMTGQSYSTKDISKATLELEEWWKQMLTSSKIIHE